MFVSCVLAVVLLLVCISVIAGCSVKENSVVVTQQEATRTDFSTVIWGDGIAYLPFASTQQEPKMWVDTLTRLQSDKNIKVTSWSPDVRVGDNSTSMEGISITFVKNP